MLATQDHPRVIEIPRPPYLGNNCQTPVRGYKVDRRGGNWAALWIDGAELLLGTYSTEQAAERNIRERIDGKQKPLFKED